MNRAHVFFSLFNLWISGRGDLLVSAVANTKMVLYNSIRGELRVVFGELDPGQTLEVTPFFFVLIFTFENGL